MDTPISQRLEEAEILCLQRNVRLTPQRYKVLQLMMHQQSAISAYDLLDLLKQSEPQAKPPTVYRALDFLLAQGFVHKVESTNSYVLCHLPGQHNHTSAMFICDECGSVTEKNASGITHTLQTLAADIHFVPKNIVIEVHGQCQRCQ